MWTHISLLFRALPLPYWGYSYNNSSSDHNKLVYPYAVSIVNHIIIIIIITVATMISAALLFIHGHLHWRYDYYNNDACLTPLIVMLESRHFLSRQKFGERLSGLPHSTHMTNGLLRLRWRVILLLLLLYLIF